MRPEVTGLKGDMADTGKITSAQTQEESEEHSVLVEESSRMALEQGVGFEYEKAKTKGSLRWSE